MMTLDKSTQKGAIIGIIGIFMGLLTAFGGVDLPALLIFSFWAIIIISVQKEWGAVFSGIKRGAPAIFFAISGMAYFAYTRFSLGQSFNETAKSFIAAIILFPPIIWAFDTNNYDKTIMRRAFIAGFILALGFLCFEALNGYAMYKLANPNVDPKELERNLGRGAFILVALLWPLLSCLEAQNAKTPLKAFIVCATLFIACQFGIDLNIAILAISSLAAILALLFPRIIMGAIIAVLAVLHGFAPVVYGFLANFAKNNWPGNMPLSYERRADMWLYAIERIKEKPIYGWGLDSAKNFQETVELGGYKWAAIQTHPHSAPLNIWLEGGVIGAALFVCTLIIGGTFALIYISKNKHSAAPFAGCICAIGLAWAFSYGAWQQWLWILLLFGSCYSIYCPEPRIIANNREQFGE